MEQKITPISIPKEFSYEPFCQQTIGDKEKSLHRYLCEKIKESCHHCPECPCIILAVVTVDENGEVINIDDDKKEKNEIGIEIQVAPAGKKLKEIKRKIKH